MAAIEKARTTTVCVTVSRQRGMMNWCQFVNFAERRRSREMTLEAGVRWLVRCPDAYDHADIRVKYVKR